MEETKIAPPKELSGMIRLAIADGRKADREIFQPFYEEFFLPIGGEFEIGTIFHEARDISKCGVCTAGMILVGTLGISPQLDENWEGYITPEWSDKIYALDHVRVGNALSAITIFYKMIEPRLDTFSYRELRDKIVNIPTPRSEKFHTWAQFDDHLDSLEIVADAYEKAGY